MQKRKRKEEHTQGMVRDVYLQVGGYVPEIYFWILIALAAFST